MVDGGFLSIVVAPGPLDKICAVPGSIVTIAARPVPVHPCRVAVRGRGRTIRGVAAVITCSMSPGRRDLPVHRRLIAVTSGTVTGDRGSVA